MHEFSLATALLHDVARIARAEGGRVRTVRVTAGPLCGVEPELLMRAFETLVDDARCDAALVGATLELDMAPLVLRCEECGTVVEQQDDVEFACTSCPSRRMAVVSGEGLLLEEIILEA